MKWFDIDKEGMRKVLARRSIAHALLELVQNALDEPGTTSVKVRISPVPRKPFAWVEVSDDAPEGFKRLSDAWTLFAESWKKGDATKRGRFNIGEKLVLAMAREAAITTTTGTVLFEEAGRRRTRASTEKGSLVWVLLRMTRADVAEAEAVLHRVLVPDGITLTVAVTGEGPGDDLSTVVEPSEPLAVSTVSLPTEIADDGGYLRPTARKTTVAIHEPADDSGAWLYEMGIPVVQLDTPWSVDVQQRIPLNLDRDNVTPAYARKVHAAVLNTMREELSRSEEHRGFSACEPWVREASGAPECDDDAFKAVLDARFGEDRVMADPSDREAGMNAVSHGYKLVYGNQLNAGKRRKLRELRAKGDDPLVPAGRTRFKSPKPYSDDPDAPQVKVIPEYDWTDRQHEVVAYAKHVAAELGVTLQLTVRIVHTTNGFAACYSPGQLDLGQLDLNLFRLGHDWFKGTGPGALERVNDLFIHEFGHHYEDNHLSSDYHDALTRLGAALTRAALERRLRPGDFGYKLSGGAQ